MLAQWRKNSAGAQKKIDQDKAAQLYNVKVKDGNTYSSINDLSGQINSANENIANKQKAVESRQSKLTKAKALVDNQADVVKGLQKKVDDLQSQLDKDPSNNALKTQLELLTGKNGRLTIANIILGGYKDEVEKQNGLLKKDEAKLQKAKDTLTKWTNLLNEAKATPEYQRLQADIEYRQSLTLVMKD
jgi:chromosome segregation ATPase